MAFNQTTNLVKNRLDTYTPEATGLWNSFKKYFQVSNQYVVGKLHRLLFPFGSKSWKRTCQINEDGSETYFPPRQDVNAPDLYIPLMAIFTYIVTVGFMAGTKGQFSPKIISSSLSACSVAVILELLVLKLVLYLINCPVSIFDLLALISYKFVGYILKDIDHYSLCINSIVKLTGIRYAYIASCLYTGICMVFFTV